jgi:hypothetical protein
MPDSVLRMILVTVIKQLNNSLVLRIQQLFVLIIKRIKTLTCGLIMIKRNSQGLIWWLMYAITLQEKIKCAKIKMIFNLLQQVWFSELINFINR